MPKKWYMVFLNAFVFLGLVLFFSNRSFADSMGSFQVAQSFRRNNPSVPPAFAKTNSVPRTAVDKQPSESGYADGAADNGDGEEGSETSGPVFNKGAMLNLESFGKNDTRKLSLGAVRDIMVGRLELLRNDRFLIGASYEIDEDNAAVELLTVEGALVQYIVVDRIKGDMFFAPTDYKPAGTKYDPKEMLGATPEEAEKWFQELVEYEKVIKDKFGEEEK